MFTLNIPGLLQQIMIMKKHMTMCDTYLHMSRHIGTCQHQEKPKGRGATVVVFVLHVDFEPTKCSSSIFNIALLFSRVGKWYARG